MITYWFGNGDNSHKARLCELMRVLLRMSVHEFAFEVESLEATLKSVTFDASKLKLWPDTKTRSPSTD